MKTIKPLVTGLSMVCLLAILLTGGCKKELADDSSKTKKPDLLLSSEGGPGKKKVLRQSPGLKIEVKGETIERISPTLKSIDKITSILNEEQGKKNQGGVMTTKSANFTASLAGTYYNCYAELNDPGPYDWYLINWTTGVYTYIGSSTDYINFNVQKPSMYGNYRVWGEGPYSAGFTGYQYMGDPYTGVSISSGILEFTNQTALDNVIERLEQAFEDHQRNFFDPMDHLTDEQMNDYADSQGFDEFLPLKEFETYFNLSSLRQKIETEELTWLAQNNPFGNGVNPDENYTIDDEVEQTVYNQYSQVKVNGFLIEPSSAVYEYEEFTKSCDPNSNNYRCTQKDKNVDTVDIASDKRIIRKITIKKGATESGGGHVFAAYVKGKARRYQQKSNGNWKKYATKLSVRIHGDVYSSGYGGAACATFKETFSKLAPFKRGYRRNEKKKWHEYTYAYYCGIHAEINANGTTSTISLQ